jgi:hypothetical protein
LSKLPVGWFLLVRVSIPGRSLRKMSVSQPRLPGGVKLLDIQLYSSSYFHMVQSFSSRPATPTYAANLNHLAASSQDL